MGSSPGRVKPKTIKLIFVASLLTMLYAALSSKNKHWLALYQNNMSEWSDMSILLTVISVI